MQGGQPLVHRDIKPSNILLDDQLEAIICDFGLLYGKEDEKPSLKKDKNVTNFQGTQAYSAQEVLNGNIPTSKCDVFSFGIIMYELLSGLAVRDTERSPIPDSGRKAEGYLVEHLHNIPDGLIPNILDVNAGWNLELASRLYKFALRCTNQLN